MHTIFFHFHISPTIYAETLRYKLENERNGKYDTGLTPVWDGRTLETLALRKEIIKNLPEHITEISFSDPIRHGLTGIEFNTFSKEKFTELKKALLSAISKITTEKLTTPGGSPYYTVEYRMYSSGFNFPNNEAEFNVTPEEIIQSEGFHVDLLETSPIILEDREKEFARFLDQGVGHFYSLGSKVIMHPDVADFVSMCNPLWGLYDYARSASVKKEEEMPFINLDNSYILNMYEKFRKMYMKYLSEELTGIEWYYYTELIIKTADLNLSIPKELDEDLLRVYGPVLCKKLHSISNVDELGFRMDSLNLFNITHVRKMVTYLINAFKLYTMQLQTQAVNNTIIQNGFKRILNNPEPAQATPELVDYTKVVEEVIKHPDIIAIREKFKKESTRRQINKGPMNPTYKLTWNEQSNVLIQLFKDLKIRPGKADSKGKKEGTLLNTSKEIAFFLKNNFDVFEKTDIDTIVTQLDSNGIDGSIVKKRGKRIPLDKYK